MAKQPYTEARAKANKKWDSKNKEARKIISARSYAKRFAKSYATLDDIAVLRELLDERERELKS